MPDCVVREEPDTEQLREFSTSYGNRTGHGAAMARSFHAYNPDQNATAFEYIAVTSP